MRWGEFNSIVSVAVTVIPKAVVCHHRGESIEITQSRKQYRAGRSANTSCFAVFPGVYSIEMVGTRVSISVVVLVVSTALAYPLRDLTVETER